MTLTVRQLAPKYDDIVIDVSGRNTGSLRAALTVADTLLIPVQPRTFDVWSVEQMAELVHEARAVNERLRALKERHPDIALADWPTASAELGYTADAIHVNKKGALTMVDVIEKAIGITVSDATVAAQ